MSLKTGAGVAALALSLGLAAAAMAQTTPPPQQKPAPQAEVPKAPVSGQIMVQDPNTVLAKEFIGQNVYTPDKTKIGSISDLILSKDAKTVEGFVIGVGGFLGIGEKYHPLPWSTLTYDESKGGYVVNLDKKMLENAPTYGMNEDFRWTPDYGRQVDKYYDAPSYW